MPCEHVLDIKKTDRQSANTLSQTFSSQSNMKLYAFDLRENGDNNGCTYAYVFVSLART